LGSKPEKTPYSKTLPPSSRLYDWNSGISPDTGMGLGRHRILSINLVSQIRQKITTSFVQFLRHIL